MLGGLGAYIAAEISGALRRNATIYGLYGFAALLLVCAGGYGLHALYVVLSVHYGPVAASLWVAGGLVVVALIVLGVATYLRNRPRPTPPLATTALVAAPIAARVLGSKTGLRAAAVAAVVILGAVLGRQFFGGSSGGGDAES